MMKIVTLRERFSSNHSAIVEQGILNDANAIIVDRWRHTESFCFAEADEIHVEMFEGKLTMPHSFKIYIPINSAFV